MRSHINFWQIIFLAYRSVLFKLIADLAECRGKAGSQRSRRRDDRYADEGCDQAVFDCGGAGFIVEEAGENALIEHENSSWNNFCGIV